MCVLLTGVLLSCLSSARADDGLLPGEVFTAIMLKTFNYDRNIGRQEKEKIVVGIANASDDAALQGFAGDIKDNMAKIESNFLLNGKPVDVNVLSLDKPFDKAKFEGQLKQNNVSVLVVIGVDPVSINNILGATGNYRSIPYAVNRVVLQKGWAWKSSRKTTSLTWWSI